MRMFSTLLVFLALISTGATSVLREPKSFPLMKNQEGRRPNVDMLPDMSYVREIKERTYKPESVETSYDFIPVFGLENNGIKSFEEPAKRAQLFVRFGKRAQTPVRFGKNVSRFMSFGRESNKSDVSANSQ